MASQQKVRWSQLRVGVLATVAMIIAAVLIFLLTQDNGGFFERKFHIRTYMDDSAGMAESAPVRLNGIPVGSIEQVKLSGSTDPHRVVEIDMSIQESYLDQIPEDSLAGISASNLLGDKYINITKGRHTQHVARGGELKSQDIQDIPQLMQQSAIILTQFQNIAGRVDGILSLVESGKGNIGKLIKDDELYNRVNATAGEVQKLVADVKNSNGTISKLLYDDGLYKDIRRPIQRLDDMLGQVQQGRGSVGKILKDEQLYNEANQAMADVRTMLDNLKAGKGTAGKILNDEELYKQVNLIVAKINVTVDKLNSGQGTLGQLVVNPQLYEGMNGVTREVQSLLKDMHANPKKFLRIKLALF